MREAAAAGSLILVFQGSPSWKRLFARSARAKASREGVPELGTVELFPPDRPSRWPWPWPRRPRRTRPSGTVPPIVSGHKGEGAVNQVAQIADELPVHPCPGNSDQVKV